MPSKAEQSEQPFSKKHVSFASSDDMERDANRGAKHSEKYLSQSAHETLPRGGKPSKDKLTLSLTKLTLNSKTK